MLILDFPDDLCVFFLEWLEIKEWMLLHVSSNNISSTALMNLMRRNVCNSCRTFTYFYLDWIVKNQININTIKVESCLKSDPLTHLNTSFVVSVRIYGNNTGFCIPKFEPQKYPSLVNLKVSSQWWNEDLLGHFLSFSSIRSLQIESEFIDDNSFVKIIKNNPNLENIKIFCLNNILHLRTICVLVNLIALEIHLESSMDDWCLDCILKLVDNNKQLNKLDVVGNQNHFQWELGGQLLTTYVKGFPQPLKDLITCLSSKSTYMWFEIRPFNIDLLWTIHECTPTLSIVYYQPPKGKNKPSPTFLADEDFLKQKFVIPKRSYLTLHELISIRSKLVH